MESQQLRWHVCLCPTHLEVAAIPFALPPSLLILKYTAAFLILLLHFFPLSSAHSSSQSFDLQHCHFLSLPCTAWSSIVTLTLCKLAILMVARSILVGQGFFDVLCCFQPSWCSKDRRIQRHSWRWAAESPVHAAIAIHDWGRQRFGAAVEANH